MRQMPQHLAGLNARMHVAMMRNLGIDGMDHVQSASEARSAFRQHAELAEAVGGSGDRGFGRGWFPAEFLLSAVVANR
jgi:hypothetical protein